MGKRYFQNRGIWRLQKWSKNGSFFGYFRDPQKCSNFEKIREINMKKWQKLCIFCDFLLQLLISRIDLCIDTRILVMFRGVDKNHQKYRSFPPKRWQISAKKHFYLDMLNGGYPLGNHLLDRISWEISAKKRIYLQIKKQKYFTKKDNLLVGKGIFRLFVRISMFFFS